MAKKKGRKEKAGLPVDLEDDIDLFHKGKDKISLNNEDDEASEDGISEEDIDVYNLGNSEDDESDSEDEGRLADREYLQREDLENTSFANCPSCCKLHCFARKGRDHRYILGCVWLEDSYVHMSIFTTNSKPHV